MIKWPKIQQFRNILRHLPEGDHLFRGSVKIHGTNAAVRRQGNKLICQSRNCVKDAGHFGFVDFIHQPEVHNWLHLRMEDEETWFGEWAGNGIQKGVGVSELPKAWYLFGSRCDGRWFYTDASAPLLGIRSLWFYGNQVTINKNCPDAAIATMQGMVADVEKQCPVALDQGVSGIGEGIVWRPYYSPLFQDTRLWFKTKGQKHSATKCRTLKKVDPELVASATAFVEKTVTEVRLRQGLEFLQEVGLPLDKSSTGKFLQWVVKDIRTEEADALEQLDWKKIGSYVGTAARVWYFKEIGNFG